LLKRPLYKDHRQGKCLYPSGGYQEAIAQFAEALRINANFAEVRNNLGNVYNDQGRYQEAIAQFTEALQINPNYAEAHYNAGIAYLKMAIATQPSENTRS